MSTYIIIIISEKGDLSSPTPLSDICWLVCTVVYNIYSASNYDGNNDVKNQHDIIIFKSLELKIYNRRG